MPRIEADTVAANRALRERQLLDGAEAILLSDGYQALTFTALSHATGLARNSIYEYHASRDDLVAAVCERELTRWTTVVRETVAAQADPLAQLHAYVDAQLDLVAQGRHGLAPALADAPLGPEARERIRAVHNKWLDLPITAFQALGHPHPAIAAALLQGLIDAATRQLHNQADPAAVRAITHTALENGLAVAASSEGRRLSID